MHVKSFLTLHGLWPEDFTKKNVFVFFPLIIFLQFFFQSRDEIEGRREVCPVVSCQLFDPLAT